MVTSIRRRRCARIFTLGYERRSLDAYFATLAFFRITVLCDVRHNPVSRKIGFSKETLARECSRIGVRYEHVPELGVPSERRRGLRSKSDREALFAEYRRTTLVEQTQALERIAAWTRDGERVALACYEHLASRCHRHCVAEALALMLRDDFEDVLVEHCG